MLIAALALLATGTQTQEPPLNVLFLGNSHTAFNDVPGMVKALLEGAGRRFTFQHLSGGHLDDMEPRADVRQAIDKGKFDYVVLQGAMISSSHKIDYPQDLAIALAKRAAKSGATPLYYAEWPRKGWDESDYIVKHYETIRKAAGGEIVPICYAWERAVAQNKGLDPWAGDGNHAVLSGSYIAACTIAYWLAPTANLGFTPRGLEPDLASKLRTASLKVVLERKKTR